MINEVTIQPTPTFEKMHWTLDVMIALLPDFQVFKNQTVMKGQHVYTDIGLLHSSIQDNVNLRNQVKEGVHIALAKVSGICENDLKDHLLGEYGKRILMMRTNLCNLLFSEN